MLHACAARFDVTGNLEKFCERLIDRACHAPSLVCMMIDRTCSTVGTTW